MPYPTQDDVMMAKSVLRWIDEHYLRLDPFAFREVGFRPIISLISDQLSVDANGIYCAGSGAIGLSLNPDKISDGRLKPFDNQSDLDVAVISSAHFETAWRDLRIASQPTLEERNQLIQEHISHQRKRLFDGAILTGKLLPVLSFGNEWISSIVKVTETISRVMEREVDVRIWIYRDYWSVRNYVSEGVVKCQRKLK
ncbi:MAG: hypothetical protein ABSG36_06980 [Acidimicrobiales bacterium]|jgi:hypothetical protein